MSDRLELCPATKLAGRRAGLLFALAETISKMVANRRRLKGALAGEGALTWAPLYEPPIVALARLVWPKKETS